MTPGVHTMPAVEYHADVIDDERPSLNASIAAILCESSPAHARAAHPRLNPTFVRVEEDKFDVGTCAHALMLEGREVVEVVYANDWRTKAAQQLRDRARADGRVPLLSKDWDRVQAMAATLRSQLDLVDADPGLYVDGKAEQTLVWEDDHGVLCRARCDWLHEDLTAIDDLKTTSASANPEKWQRTLFDIGADVQVAFYLRGLERLTGRSYGCEAFRYVVIETAPPFALSVVSLSPHGLELGRRKVAYAIEAWARCLLNEEWPGYPRRPVFVDPPPWVEQRWLEREITGVAA